MGTNSVQEDDVIAKNESDPEEASFHESGELNPPEPLKFEDVLKQKLLKAREVGCINSKKLERIFRSMKPL